MENSQQLTPLCTYNKQVYQVCINPKCTQVCFICDNKCQCKLLHKKCDKVDWDYIYDNLDKNIIKNTQEFKSFSDRLDQLYQNTIKDITKAYDDFKIWRDDFGLTEYQSTFLQLIEEGRFTEMTSIKMYQIRKEIKTPSKIIMKSENQFKEEAELIINYTEKVIEQLKGIYSQNKVIKEQLEEQRQDKNNGDKIKKIQHIQTKVNSAHKLLGLNQNGSRFFTMINEGVIEKQLEKIIEKINLNEESINENKKITKETINNIKQGIELKIEKLTETVAENMLDMNSKIKQNSQKLQKSISTQTKIEKYESLLKTKLNIIKFNLLSILENKLSDQLILSTTGKSPILQNECLSICSKLEENINKVMKDYSSNEITLQKLNQEFSRFETQIQQTWKQLELKIIVQAENIKMMKTISMFFAKKINKMNQLYKASENNFQVSKFWEKCNGKINTLTILKTQFGKIIGGYTPLAWNKSLSNYQQDTSKQTFLFSITQKHKIPISQNQQYALYHNASDGPTFGGGHDLYICDKANLTESSQGNIGSTYNNGEYTYSNQQSLKKWSGQSNGYYFLIQQWEVYEITFV